MRTILLHLDTSPHPSVFDRIVALDAGADEVLSYGGVTGATARDLVHGAIFTRGIKDLSKTAIFIGGADLEAAERVLTAVRAAFFGPMRVSVMFDPNGANTTAVAAVARLRDAAGDVRGLRAVVTAASGPVGQRAAGLLAREGADVTVTSRRAADGGLAEALMRRFGGTIHQRVLARPEDAAASLDGAGLLLSAGPAGVCLVPRAAWANRPGLRAVADLNAVPPLGIEGVESTDKGDVRDGVRAFGALGVGGLKMTIHKACIGRLFERTDLVFDAETIADFHQRLASGGR